MEELYYVDRPSIPATSQVVVRLGAILEHAVGIDASDINPSYRGDAVEIKAVDGVVDGTLVYFPGVSYAELISASQFETDPDEHLVTPDDGVDITEPLSSIDELSSTDYRSEERLLNLELALSVAKQQVQDIEDEIANEEEALD